MARPETALAGPPKPTAPYKLTRLAAVSGQLGVPAPESFGRGLPVASGAPAYPGGSGESALASGGAESGEEITPGPYAMLLIGLCLAAFMAFRRVAQR